MTAPTAGHQPTLEIGAGEHPDGRFDFHADVLPLPDIEVVCQMDQLPFRTGSLGGIRANHVLEHQSWQLIEPTLVEWARVLAPGGLLDIGVPDARTIARQWIAGELDILGANHWLLGGHAERLAHRGTDGRGVPRWIWNAHHTLFDADWLTALLQGTGFEQIEITAYRDRHLRCSCRRVPNADPVSRR